MYDSVYSLLDLAGRSTSPWHTAEAAAGRLDAAGFQELALSDSFAVKKGSSYYVKIFGSSVLAFVVGEGNLTAPNALRVAASHTISLDCASS